MDQDPTPVRETIKTGNWILKRKLGRIVGTVAADQPAPISRRQERLERKPRIPPPPISFDDSVDIGGALQATERAVGQRCVADRMPPVRRPGQ